MCEPILVLAALVDNGWGILLFALLALLLVCLLACSLAWWDRMLERRRIEQHAESLDRLNNRAPDAKGYCARAQYRQTRHRESNGYLVLGKAITHYRYFVDGAEVQHPFPGND